MKREIKTLSREISSLITDAEIKAYASEKAKTIVIRETINGNSNDNPRNTTKAESKIISSIISGALMGIRYGSDINSVADSAEFIAMQLLPGAGKSYDKPHVNTYDTIYCPIVEWARTQEQKA